MLYWILTRTTCINFKRVFTSTEEFSANVCVCGVCLPQLEIAADCNLKNVYFFSSKSYSVVIIEIWILLFSSESGGK